MFLFIKQYKHSKQLLKAFKQLKYKNKQKLHTSAPLQTITYTTYTNNYHYLYFDITMESTKNNAQKVWSAIVKHAKEHHRSVNAAVNVYYPQPTGLSPRGAPAKTVYSTSSSARSSYEKN